MSRGDGPISPLVRSVWTTLARLLERYLAAARRTAPHFRLMWTVVMREAAAADTALQRIAVTHLAIARSIVAWLGILWTATIRRAKHRLRPVWTAVANEATAADTAIRRIAATHLAIARSIAGWPAILRTAAIRRAKHRL